VMAESSDVLELLSRASAILEGKEKGLPEEAKRLYTLACSSMDEATDKNPKSHNLVYLSAKCYFERARNAKLYKLEDFEHYEKCISKSLSQIQRASEIKPQDQTTFILWGKILQHEAESTQNLKENEDFLIGAIENLLKATEYGTSTTELYQLLEHCLDPLINNAKQRERNGSAVYHVAGEFTKQGGGKKSLNWKVRWFVVNDTNISYYKDKKEWENGPVKGSPAQPKGTIDFAEVTDITTHKDFICNVEKRPKTTTACLHVVTIHRTYNMLGFQSLEHTEQWIGILKHALRCYNAKKAAKKWLRDHSSLKSS